jgi:hypothetical protein
MSKESEHANIKQHTFSDGVSLDLEKVQPEAARIFIEMRESCIETKSLERFNSDKDILGEFGQHMEKMSPYYLNHIFDVSYLPYPKNEIRDALIRDYGRTTDTNYRMSINRGLHVLTRYQEEVGPFPIVINPEFEELLTESKEFDTTKIEKIRKKYLEDIEKDIATRQSFEDS